jgi:hypothetical protein
MRKLKYQPHPYCIYTKTPDYTGIAQFGLCRFNNFGFSSQNNTEVIKSKIRVICIGGSAVELSFGDNPDNTFPHWVGLFLGDKYEVLNAGVCGYTTAEMLVNFELNLLDFNPDYLVVYEMFNDVLYGGLPSGFKSDYSHIRKNEGLTGGSRCLTDRINKPIIPAQEIPEKAVLTYKRNLKSICSIALANGVHPILVKYNYNPTIETSETIYPLDGMGLNDSTKMFVNGLKRYSEVPKTLSKENDKISYLETEPILERDFVDSCHFKTSGMKKMGKSISDFIKQKQGD